MIIESSAPLGLTWPAYYRYLALVSFHPGATTVNFALSLLARCRIQTRDDGRIVLESRDRKIAFETSLGAIEDLLLEERLELISKLVHFFKPTTGFHLVAESEAPAGAGLGGFIGPGHRLYRRVESPGGNVMIAEVCDYRCKH